MGQAGRFDRHSPEGVKGERIMAERRMFTKKITDGDLFTSMPPTTQCLYFHLCMTADDDGFSNQVRQALFNAHATTDDFNVLVQKRFIIPFDSGVIVIKHWRMHNWVRTDRYHETKFLEEKASLVLKDNGVYSQKNDVGMTNDIPSDNQVTYQPHTEVRLGKDSIGYIELSKDNSCTTPLKKAAVQYADVEALPCVNGDVWKCDMDFYQECLRLYPNVDLEQEFRNMRGWLNTHNKKTYRGMKRFVNGWLSREQNKGGKKQKAKAFNIEEWN